MTERRGHLTVDDVAVSFGSTPVLVGVSVDVAAGEVVAMLGPSGSGKSTLLRIIAGLVTPDVGRIRLDGADITEMPTHRRQVGLVFQDEQLFTHLDVAANIEFGLRMRGDSADSRRRRAAAMLDLVGLADFGARTVTSLSGGEAKRVALARSLAPRPTVLLLDEPLTGLDRVLHDRLAVDLAVMLRAEATTSIIVTHDRDEADIVADRIVNMAELEGTGR
ncbi:N/A [soil metagenome]